MSDGLFNISKGAWAEMVRDGASAILMLVLKTAESDALMRDRATVTAVLSGSTEADFTNYARKTGITGTLTVDNTNDRVDLDVPDQTFTSAGGATNNTTAKVVFAYENAAADASRVPMGHFDFVTTTDGSDLIVQIAAAGILRAA